VYAAINVKDATIVDEFLEKLGSLLANASWLSTGWTGSDYATLDLGQDQKVHCHALIFGPAKVRLFWARIGDVLFVASQLSVLENLWKVSKDSSLDVRDNCGPSANAMIRLRPSSWKEVLPDIRLSWRENARQACHRNLAPLTALARALAAIQESLGETVLPGDILSAIDTYPFLGVERACPNGGIYCFDAESSAVTCTAHGSRQKPFQLGAQDDNQRILTQEMRRATAALSFLEDGLHANLILDRAVRE
jgi:hypothetical protein